MGKESFLRSIYWLSFLKSLSYNEDVEACSEEVSTKQNKCLITKIITFYRHFSCFNLSEVFKSTFLFNETKAFFKLTTVAMYIALPLLLHPTQSLKKYKTCYSIPGLQQVRLEHPVHPVADRDDPVVRRQQGRVLWRPSEASGQGRHQPGKEAGAGVTNQGILTEGEGSIQFTSLN